MLDRLIDLEPGNRDGESAQPHAIGAAIETCGAARSGVAAELAAKPPEPPDESVKEVNRSAYVYGLPDLSSLTMATSGDRNRLIRQIVAAINLFEPRLANVRLVMVETADSAKNEVRLRIEAMLRMDPVAGADLIRHGD